MLFACTQGDLTQRLAACADAVTQIEFSQGEDATALTKIGEQWVVNRGRPADAERMFHWWRVALNWQLRPLLVDEAMERKITAQVVREGVRTAVYTKRLTRPALTFYVHDLGQAGVVVCHGDRLFLADAPYAGHNITDVYSARPGFWKDATVFAYLPLDLDTVRVEHLQRPAASFQLARNGDEWQPAPVGGTPAVARKNEALINRYVTYFQQVSADAMLDSLPAATLAGVHQHLQHRISIKSAQGNLTVELFGIPPAAGEGYDTDKCLLFIVETKEWARASWVSFDLLLRNLSDFVEKK